MSKALTAAERFAAMAPKAADLADLAGTVTVPVSEVEGYAGSFGALYLGTLDEAGTVHVRAYIGTDTGSLRKASNLFKVTPTAVNRHESQHQSRKGVMKWAWGDPSDPTSNFVVLFIPDKAATEALQLDFG